jgi:hypothetical protein
LFCRLLELLGDIRITSKRTSTLDPTLDGSGPRSRSGEHKDRKLRLDTTHPLGSNPDDLVFLYL